MVIGCCDEILGRLVGFDLDSLSHNQQLTDNSFPPIESIESIAPGWVGHGTRARPYFATPFWRAFWGGKWEPERCKGRQIRLLPRVPADEAAPCTHFVCGPRCGLAVGRCGRRIQTVTLAIRSHTQSQETVRQGVIDEDPTKGRAICIAMPRAAVSCARLARGTQGRDE